MNIKASYWYQMLDHKKAIFIYYFVIVCIYIVNILLSYVYGPGEVLISGMDFATMIFLFVTGLCSFKENFGMLLQNSISRKSIFIGRLLTVISIAGIMAILDRIFITLCNQLFSGENNFLVTIIFEQLYVPKHPEMSQIAIMLSSLLYTFCLYMSVLAIGYMISLLFFRLGKAGKIAVGVGVPSLYFIVIPLLDGLWFQNRLILSIAAFLNSAYGLSSGNFWNAILTSLFLFALASFLGWLLIRKAIVRK